MSMDFNQAADLLKGKTALITGASQGIGKMVGVSGSKRIVGVI
mgnify:CR=1 FL=1